MRKREAERLPERSSRRSSPRSSARASDAVHEMVDDGEARSPIRTIAPRVEEGRNWALRLRDRDRKLIAKIEEALARLDAGTFGTLHDAAGGRSSPARLRARPVTDLCIDCKTEAERRGALTGEPATPGGCAEG